MIGENEREEDGVGGSCQRSYQELPLAQGKKAIVVMMFGRKWKKSNVKKLLVCIFLLEAGWNGLSGFTGLSASHTYYTRQPWQKRSRRFSSFVACS